MDWPQHLLRVSDLTGLGLGALLDIAAHMKTDPGGRRGALSGATLGCYFERPSLRARASVAGAAHRLGMLPIDLDSAEFPLDGQQPVDQLGRLLGVLAGRVLVLTTEHERLRALARVADVPVLNALSDEHDPSQAVGDLLTLRERFGRLEGLVLAYVGEPGPVAHSLMEAGALAGLHVRVACPRDREPPAGLRTAAELLADAHGGSITITDDPLAAVAEADVVTTDVWASPAGESERRRYRVTPALMARAKATAVFMHCLPACEGEEVSAAVLEGPRSIVWQQAANRLPAEQAAIYALTADRDSAR